MIPSGSNSSPAGLFWFPPFISWFLYREQGIYWTKASWWINWSHHLESFTVAIMTLLTVMDYMCHKWKHICSICHNNNSFLPSFMTDHRDLTRVTQQMLHVDRIFWEQKSWCQVFSGIHVAQSVVICVVFCMFFECLFFFHWRLLISPLVSSPFPYYVLRLYLD